MAVNTVVKWTIKKGFQSKHEIGCRKNQTRLIGVVVSFTCEDEDLSSARFCRKLIMAALDTTQQCDDGPMK